MTTKEQNKIVTDFDTIKTEVRTENPDFTDKQIREEAKEIRKERLAEVKEQKSKNELTIEAEQDEFKHLEEFINCDRVSMLIRVESRFGLRFEII